jgi:transposase
MVCHKADAAQQAAWRSSGERPSCPNGIFWVLKSGAPWRDLPEAFGPYTTCYNRFVRWRRAGVWSGIIDALAGAHDAAVQMIDTSIVRVHQHGACITRNQHQSMGRTRGGLTSEFMRSWIAMAFRSGWR